MLTALQYFLLTKIAPTEPHTLNASLSRQVCNSTDTKPDAILTQLFQSAMRAAICAALAGLTLR
jgi:hypothetical protein